MERFIKVLQHEVPDHDTRVRVYQAFLEYRLNRKTRWSRVDPRRPRILALCCEQDAALQEAYVRHVS